MTNRYDTATPYVAVFVIFRENNKVAFLLRENTQWMNGYYTLPSGKVEKSEFCLDAAVRECREEVGVTVSPDQLKFVHVSDRHGDSDWMDVYFEASNWQGKIENAEPDIHSELAWFELDKLPKNIIPSQVAALASIQGNDKFSQYTSVG